MIGIDIVDLEDPSFKERNARSLDLIKSKEDVLIEHKYLFWILWSAKEAVFKCRREPLNFAPTKIPIAIKEDENGITFSSNELSGKVILTDQYMIAICGNMDEFDFHTFEKNNNNWSEGIRFMIIEFFRDHGQDYHIGSDDLNLPTIEPLNEIISISHHGRFGAVAYPKKLL
ncbi:4'-phosphopantetheinyl transferase superfamily protein [Ekhidna sp.]|uniref:4'-phosphopantetheinyl transferase family protein n=1 Tax=Ekhidna sp. TaxID=2608089 RepID=UPI003296C341